MIFFARSKSSPSKTFYHSTTEVHDWYRWHFVIYLLFFKLFRTLSSFDHRRWQLLAIKKCWLFDTNFFYSSLDYSCTVIVIAKRWVKNETFSQYIFHVANITIRSYTKIKFPSAFLRHRAEQTTHVHPSRTPCLVCKSHAFNGFRKFRLCFD